jgi:putative GTP pyrophosphokinase
MQTSDSESFDFDEHRRTAVEEYRKIRPTYELFASTVQGVLTTALKRSRVQFHSIEARAKLLDSFGRKSAKPSGADPNVPKYTNPLLEIEDLGGVRVITYFLSDINKVDTIIKEQFDVLEKTDKSKLLRERQGLGYQSVHYVVRFFDNRTALPEYGQFDGLKLEIQLRTILQHAWAEIEHDIQYHSVETIPSAIRQRFTSLAGLLEIADREFQAIQKADAELRRSARISLQAGNLATVEITADSLKAYLDRELGPDGRMTDFSYDYTAKQLRQMGFSTLQEVDDCIRGYDHDRLSRIAYGTRQGQLSRFEYQLLAGMGIHFIDRHPWRVMDWFEDRQRHFLTKFEENGIVIREYSPRSNPQPADPPQTALPDPANSHPSQGR